MSDKKRLDVLVVELGLSETRQKAQRLIMAGKIFVDEQKVDKPGVKIDANSKIELRGKNLKYVSRGGYKLEKAIESFNIDLDNKICIDIGASTGGFTDCMLQNNASKVYSVDVGYGQIAWKLRQDSKVVVMDRTNFRYVTKEDIKEEVDFISVDVSFISLKLIIPPAVKLLKQNGELICLIKPQFEAGKENVGKKGVVRDKNTHVKVIKDIICFCEENFLEVVDLAYSPIRGPKGNIEYLLYIKKTGANSYFDRNKIINVVNNSHIET